MRRLIPGLLLLATIATGAAACNSDDTTTPPTTPTPPNVTETFTGTLTLNGASTFRFSAAAAGTVTATLTTVGPDATLTIGLSLGNWTGSACQLVVANDAAGQTAAVSGTVTAPATLCVRVYDPASKVTTAADFTVTVVHP